MNFDPEKHHRRSIRLKDYDYSREGMYFVTICVQDRECLFGEIAHGKMILNDAGLMIQKIWDELPEFYPGVAIDQFVVMPDHMHGIVILRRGGPPCPPSAADPNPDPNPDPKNDRPVTDGRARGPARTVGSDAGNGGPISLSDAVHRFKSFTTAKYRHGVADLGWLPFPGRLWQRNYYECIVRNEQSLHRIRDYIAQNPSRPTPPYDTSTVGAGPRARPQFGAIEFPRRKMWSDDECMDVCGDDERITRG